MQTVHLIATSHPGLPRRAVQLLDACWHTRSSESAEVCISLLSYALFSSEPPALLWPPYLYDFFPFISSSLFLYLFTSLIHLFILYLIFPFFPFFLSFLPLSLLLSLLLLSLFPGFFSLPLAKEEDELEGRGRKRPQAQRVKKASKGGQRRKRSGPTSDQIDEVRWDEFCSVEFGSLQRSSVD